MAHSKDRPRLHAALTALVVGLAALLLLMRPGASAAAPDCLLTVNAPGSYYGIAAITSGSVDCATRKNTLRFSIVLQRDGVVVDSGERTCHKAVTCWSYLVHDDEDGDQRWCATVGARVGSQSLAPVTRCEDDPQL
jgi:hypothetical protein